MQVSSSCDTSHDPREDDEHSDLEMSCEDVTADYPADTSAGIYDAGSYDRMMGDQDADEEDAEIKNKPLNRSVPLLIQCALDSTEFRNRHSLRSRSLVHVYLCDKFN